MAVRISLIKSIALVSIAGLFFGVVKAASFKWDIADSGVLRIVTEGSNQGLISGTGILVNKKGYVITNYHVVGSYIENPANNSYVLDGGRGKQYRKRYQLKWYSREYDIAVIKVEGLDPKRFPLVFANSESRYVNKGIEVFSLGFPGASDVGGIQLEPVLKNGIISVRRRFSLRKGAKPIRMFEHNATINSGNSGSPLLDSCGRVIGMNQSKARSKLVSTQSRVNIAEGTFWSIRSSVLMLALKSQKITFSLNKNRCTSSGLVADSGNDSYQVWPFVILFIGLSLSFMFLLILLKRMKSQHPAEGVSEYVKREISQFLKNRSSKRVSRKIYSSREDITMANPQGISAYGILINCESDDDTQGIEIRLRPLLVGRSKSADIKLKDERVGRKHAYIGWDLTDQKFYVRDLGSVNGTWIATGKKLAVNKRIYINPGEKFCFADQSLMFYIKKGNM